MQVYYDRDADVGLIKNKKIAVIGYGSQGHAHALNLRDSGVKNVVVALRAGSPSAKKAKAEKLKVMTNAEAAKWADVVMMLSPDEGQAQIYQADLKDNMKKGAALAFAHGLAVHFQLIEPRADLDIFMVAPKGPGHTVRSEYQRGAGVPCLLAVDQDATGNAHDLGQPLELVFEIPCRREAKGGMGAEGFDAGRNVGQIRQYLTFVDVLVVRQGLGYHRQLLVHVVQRGCHLPCQWQRQQ